MPTEPAERATGGRAGRWALAILLPVGAGLLQWAAWAWIHPFVWFLFFPAVFISASLAGFVEGLFSTALSVLIVWLFFLSPDSIFQSGNDTGPWSAALFILMALLFCDSQSRLRRSRRKAAELLASERAAREKMTDLYRKTVETDALKSRFLANLSHDLRTPLSLIIAPLSRRLSDPALPAAVRQEDGMILRNADLLLRQLSDLLDVARLESGFMSCSYSRFDVAGLVRATLAQFEPLAAGKAIDLRFEGETGFEVDCDAGKLQRILFNLLSNAIRFTPGEGMVTVRLRARPEDLDIEVEDSGPGVPADQRDTVFERFHQGGRSGDGTSGLGLAIVREFAGLLGGRVSVTDGPAGGARFVVELPRHAPAGSRFGDGSPPSFGPVRGDGRLPLPSPSPTPPSPGADHDGSDAPLVLVVEDNPDMAAFIADILRPRYRVAVVHDGAAGLARAATLEPDLILCDLAMPGMDGEAMVSELRKQPKGAGLPVVMLTARTDDRQRVRMLRAGVMDYVIKPFAVDELLARVEGVIRKRDLGREELRNSEDSYRSLFENMMNGYAYCRMIYDGAEPVDFVYIDVNKAFERHTGLHDVIGRRVSEVIPGLKESDPELFGIYGRVARGGSPERFETYVGAMDMWFSISVYSPGPDHFVSVFDVITERKMSEERIRVSEERLQLALEATGDGLWDWDLRRKQTYVTPQCCEMTGYRPEEVVPDLAFLKRVAHPDDLAGILEAVRGHLEGEKPACDLDCRVLTASGKIRWIRSRGRVVERDETGAPLRMVGTITDITAQKAAEEAARRQTSELAERNAELERFNRVTVGRELDMIVLKQQVNALSRELGRERPFPLSFLAARTRPAEDAEP